MGGMWVFVGLIVLFAPKQEVVEIDLSQTPSAAPSLTVCPSCEIASLREAIEMAPPGATVYVLGGVYRESTLVVRKPLTLIGEDNPVLDGEGKYEILVVDSVDGFIIRGFVFRGSGISFMRDQAALRLRNTSNCVVENNVFRDNFFAIYLENVHTCMVRGNDVQGPRRTENFSGNAIHVWSAYNIWVEGNHLSGHRDGIYFEFVRDSYVEDNVSEDHVRYGMHFMFSEDIEFRRNVFRSSGAGVAVMYSKRTYLRENRFEYNWGPAAYGLLLKEIYDSEVEQNVFFKNTVGLYAEGSNRILVRGNTFEKNGWAIRILGNSMAMSFMYNNIMENTFEASINTPRAYNTFLFNYWAAYTGYDLNRDGYGDVPHRPVGLFTQLVEQYPPSLILLHSPLEYLIKYTERLLPVLLPSAIEDDRPLMGRIVWSKSETSSSDTARSRP